MFQRKMNERMEKQEGTLKLTMGIVGVTIVLLVVSMMLLKYILVGTVTAYLGQSGIKEEIQGQIHSYF